MANYNCYGFALYRVNINKRPGEIAEQKANSYTDLDERQKLNNRIVANTINGEYDLESVKSNTLLDLEILGYKQVKEIKKSDISTASGTVICLRVGTDFHFMRYVKSKNIGYISQELQPY